MKNLTQFLEKLVKDDGFVLEDANKKQHIIGKPLKNPPIKLKLLDKSLHYKLLLLPDLYFGEAYANGSAVIENGTLTEFLEIAMKNIGRGPTSNYATVIKKLMGIYSYITNFNFVGKSKSNVAHHYDLSDNFLNDMKNWIENDKMKWKETIDVGIESAPNAFLKLFKGENFGKMLVKIAEE